MKCPLSIIRRRRLSLEFINAGHPKAGSRRKLIDWEQDYPMIIAEVNKVAGCEVRSPYLHWFTFIGYFNAIETGN